MRMLYTAHQERIALEDSMVMECHQRATLLLCVRTGYAFTLATRSHWL